MRNGGSLREAAWWGQVGARTEPKERDGEPPSQGGVGRQEEGVTSCEDRGAGAEK